MYTDVGLFNTEHLLCTWHCAVYSLLHSENYLGSKQWKISYLISEKSSNEEKKNNYFIIHYHCTSSYLGIFPVNNFS